MPVHEYSIWEAQGYIHIDVDGVMRCNCCAKPGTPTLDVNDMLAEKDRIIAALHIMAVDGLTIMHDTAMPLDTAIAQVDTVIEQARSGK